MGGPLDRAEARSLIVKHHYLHSFPSGWCFCYWHDGAVVVFSISANKNLAPFLFGPGATVLELARLWAPDEHRDSLLTEAIAAATRSLRCYAQVDGLVSFADPNHGHHGGIYQAASWIYTGQSEETRVYRLPGGRTVARRAFHSGTLSRIPDVAPLRLPGKHRYVKPLTRAAKRHLRIPAQPYPKPQTPILTA